MAELRAYREQRTGWIEQLTDVLEDDGSGREFDRFVCHWQGEGPQGSHMRFGPAAVSLEVALAWCAEHAGRAFVDGFGRTRWSVGRPDDGFPPLPAVPARSALFWDEHVGDGGGAG